ncbi:YadA family autotransporter adhesin, partial [Necropsobacter massiliensis]|uniref:YadA family autotransporter adhesin n=1 Tax=Necropsobacter massiliensis TaxID=1400001 RepID=UPI000694C4A3
TAAASSATEASNSAGAAASSATAAASSANKAETIVEKVLGEDDGDDSTTNYGVDSKASATNASAFGNKAQGTAENTTAVGQGAQASGQNSTAIGRGSKASGRNAVALGANSVASEDNTVSVGSSGNERRITHVANGVNATDAVNKSQLDQLSRDINKTNHAVVKLSEHVDKVDKDLRAGIAGATAIGFLQRPNAPGRSIVSVGVGSYRGESAVAVGYARNSYNNKISIKVGAGINSRNDVNWGGSIGYQW